MNSPHLTTYERLLLATLQVQTHQTELEFLTSTGGKSLKHLQRCLRVLTLSGLVIINLLPDAPVSYSLANTIVPSPATGSEVL